MTEEGGAFRALQQLVQELDAYKSPAPRMSTQELAALRAQLDREIEADDRAYAMREALDPSEK